MISGALEGRPCPRPSVIEDYLTALSAQLPAPIVEELADGLDETRQRYLRQGLDAEAAAGAARGESSGAPDVILADFASQSPGRRSSPQDSWPQDR